MRRRRAGAALRLVDVALVASLLLLGGSIAWYARSHRHHKLAEGPSPVPAALAKCADDLRVLPALRDTAYLEDRNVYTWRLDGNLFDLTFANAYISRLVALAGGTVEDGTDTEQEQRLLLMDSPRDLTWELVLQLDEKHRYPVQRPGLSVIVDDFGLLSGSDLEDFCTQTDSAVCFAVMPGEDYSRETMERAVATGHEVLVHIPMEPIGYPREDPGAQAIFVDMSPREIRGRVQQYLRELPQARGANNHMGSLATTDANVMNAVLSELQDKGLYFVDSRTIASSVAYGMAMERGMNALNRDVFLDVPDATRKTMDEHMGTLRKVLAAQGQAVVITHCMPSGRLEYLRRFLARVPELGAELMPVSALFYQAAPPIP